MTRREHHLTWENFRSSIIVKGEQRVHRISESPLIELFSDGVGERIGIWVETVETAIPPEMLKLAFIAIRVFTQRHRRLLEVASSSSQLQRQFYHFAVAVAERILTGNAAPIEAVASELHCFAEMLEEKSVLGIECQLGILGELLVLERLVVRNGPDAVEAWIGPCGEPHDIRIATQEFEVKTTVTSKRVHTINGAEQLVPSKDCLLFLISIVLGPTGKGDGFSLPEKAEAILSRLASAPSRAEQFRAALKGCSLRKEDYVFYGRRYALRRPLAVVPIKKGFPALTRPVIQRALGEQAKRVDSLHYQVNVEGLEIEEGSQDFPVILSL
jgi:hypothetical protein